jgi:WD40 repeat protein
MDAPNQPPQQFTGESRIQNIAASPDGRWLVLITRSTDLSIWDLKNPTAPPHVVKSEERNFTAAFSADSSLLALGGADQVAQVLNTESWTPALAEERHGGIVSGVVFDPQNRFVVTGSFDGEISVRSLPDGKPLFDPLVNQAAVTNLVCSPDGSCLAAVCADNTISLWDLKTGRQIGNVLHHRTAISAVQFSPDGHLLASGSWDHTVRIWDVETGLQVDLPQVLPSRVNAVAFSADGNQLAMGEENGDLAIWSLHNHISGSPESLAELSRAVRAIAGCDFDANGIIKPVSSDTLLPAWPTSRQPKDDYQRVLKWLVDPAEKSQPSPF